VSKLTSELVEHLLHFDDRGFVAHVNLVAEEREIPGDKSVIFQPGCETKRR